MMPSIVTVSCGHTAKWMLTKGDISARAWRGYWSSIWGPHWFCSSGAWGAWGPNHSISNWKLFILVRRRLNCWRNNGFLCIFACTAVMTKLQLFSWAKWHRVYDLVHILLYAWIMMTLLFAWGEQQRSSGERSHSTKPRISALLGNQLALALHYWAISWQLNNILPLNFPRMRARETWCSTSLIAAFMYWTLRRSQ